MLGAVAAAIGTVGAGDDIEALAVQGVAVIDVKVYGVVEAVFGQCGGHTGDHGEALQGKALTEEAVAAIV